MKAILRTRPDRSKAEATFREEKIFLTGDIASSIFCLIDLANAAFQNHLRNDETDGGRSRWDWWVKICQTTWAEIKFFPKDDIDESFDLKLHLDFTIAEGAGLSNLGLRLGFSHRVGQGSENYPSVSIFSANDQPRSLQVYCERVHLFRPAVVRALLSQGHPLLFHISEQNLFSCISLLLAKLEEQVREVSENFSSEVPSQTAPQ